MTGIPSREEILRIVANRKDLIAPPAEPEDPDVLERARKSLYKKQVYCERSEKGLCVQCGGARGSDPERKTCLSCRLKNKAERDRRHARYKAVGKCSCGRDKEESANHCGTCMMRFRERRRRRIRKLLAQGKCSTCGGEKEQPQMSTCRSCLNKREAAKRRRLDEANEKRKKALTLRVA